MIADMQNPCCIKDSCAWWEEEYMLDINLGGHCGMSR
jgi:hypothetical protein